MRIFYLLAWVAFFVTTAQADDQCNAWLKNTKAIPGQRDCETVCSSFGIDMGTFTCPLQCKDYCHVCVVDPFWLKALNAESAPFKPLKDSDRARVIEALSKMPQNFKPKSLKAIVRASDFDPLAHANPASSSTDLIILFPPVFESKAPIDRILFHELIHHLIFNEWSQTLADYKQMTKWNSTDSAEPRSGGFVESDGRDSPDEDLANNVEYFVFEPKKLKSVSPKIFDWIEKRMKSQISLGKGCDASTDSKK